MSQLPYKYKFIFFVQLAVLMALIILGTVSYRKITGVIEQEMGMRAQGVALAASHLINSKMDEYLELKTAEDEQTPFYLEMKRIFQDFKKSNNLRYMYTEKRISEDKIIYILDAEPKDSEYASHIGDEDDMNVLRQRAYGSGRPDYGPLTDDPVWGMFITGYAPLVNSENSELVGLIGVDIEATEAFALFDEIRLVIILTSMIVFAISYGVTYKLADMMTRPMFIDGLTNTYNHKFFQESLAGEIHRASRMGGPLCMLMMDLDYFKQVNDTYGHVFGDLILRSTAEIMKKNLRKGDILARYGGEEFALVMPHTEIGDAFVIASRIRDEVEKRTTCCDRTGKGVVVTISIGVAEWRPGMTRNELIERADRAMYESKHRNRNLVTVFTEDLLHSRGPA
ncbi:MAG: hypothetical protein CVU89_14340 [Firmicutes bacterium HGW-Firmicutes-14]|jgi:diguanylate cyclase (GGDEF)-like protein|nr:MAG: hypothetical protein CVU89_14340 [Firmicutes bacterium HGW-Firmicutes-14]